MCFPRGFQKKKKRVVRVELQLVQLFKQLFNKLTSVVNILFQECTVTHSITFLSIVFLNHKLQTAKKHSSLLTFVIQGLRKIDVKLSL